MEFVSIQLARRLEIAEAEAARECTESLQRDRPDIGGAILDIMGGIATFAGRGSPITQAVGIGLHGPVEKGEFVRLEEFYREHGSHVEIELCPMADASLTKLLGRRGYRVIEFSNVAFCTVEPRQAGRGAMPSGVEVRQINQSEARHWAEVVAEGFADEFPITPELIEVMEMFSRRRSGQFYFATLDGQIAGGAAFAVHEGVRGCFGASTLPRFRRRGVQSALLNVRLVAAAEAGCDLAMSIALVGSASHRNLERHGFRPAYTRVKFTNAPPKSE